MVKQHERLGQMARLADAPASTPEGLAHRAATAALASGRAVGTHTLSAELVRLGWRGLLASMAVAAALLTGSFRDTAAPQRTAVQAWQELVDAPLRSVAGSGFLGMEEG